MKKKLRVALCSFGMSGRVFHAPLIEALPQFELSTVLERHRNESKERYPHAKIVRKYEEVLGEEAIDLIVVNTPDHLHFEMAKQALDAQKHVLIEKPFTQTAAQARELIDQARKNNLILSVFQNRRWDSDFLTVKKVLAEKLLGRLVEFESHFDRFRNFVRPDSWKEQAGNGTGTLYNLGSHLIDQALVLFGKPQAVLADLRKARTGTQVDDQISLQLLYSEVKVSLKSSYLVREAQPRFILHGTHGSFVKYGLDPQEAALSRGKMPNTPGWGAEAESLWGTLNTEINGLHLRGKIETIAGNYKDLYENLFLAITQGKELAVKPEEPLLGIKIIQAAQQSYHEKKWIWI